MTKYYCKQKFNWAQVSLSDGKIQSCCKSSEDTTSFQQISGKSFGFFNYEKIKKDRQSMLDGKKISSCSHCWNLEDRGLPSRRIQTQSNVQDITGVDNCVPESLNIVIGDVCAMTCIYCCKKYSQSWRQDLVNNGDYKDLVTDDPRYHLSTRDKILMRISSNQLQQTRLYQEILSQITAGRSQIQQVEITGGEPLLSNNLQQILDIFVEQSAKIKIFTGLGVKPAYLARHLAKFDNQQITFVVSAENIGNLHEFSRYGSSYQDFKKNITILQRLGFTYQYCCSISNTTIFGILEFLQGLDVIDYSDIVYTVDTVADPDYLAPSVIDPTSKDLILAGIANHPILHHIIPIVKAPCSDLQRQNARAFIFEFAKRRKLSLDIFPPNFLSWLQKS